MANAKKTGFMEKDDEGKKRVSDGKLAKFSKNLLFNINSRDYCQGKEKSFHTG